MDRNAFISAGQEFLQAYQDSKADSWTPPEGRYLCTGEGYRLVTDWENRNGAIELVVIPYARIASHPEFEGRKFKLGFFPISNLDRLGLLLVPETGMEPVDMGEIHDALNAAFGGEVTEDNPSVRGAVMTVEVSATYSKKRKQEYTNCAIVDYPVVEDSGEPADSGASETEAVPDKEAT